MVADKHDALDAGLSAFVDLEHEIDPAVTPRNRSGRDPRRVTAAVSIDIGEARDVALHRGPGHRSRWFRLDRLLEIGVLELLVAFELHAADQRRFDHRDHHTRTGPGDLHILVIFNNADPDDIGISVGLGGMSPVVLSETLGAPADVFANFFTRGHSLDLLGAE